MSNKYSDIVIIGGGISGLYSAYNIQKISPGTSITILERYKKKWFGGRLGNEFFHGVQIVNGAGVGRKEKDYLLIELMKELKIPYTEFHLKTYYANTISPPCNTKKTISYLKKEYKKQNSPRKTFKEFTFPLLGVEMYNNFITCAGYTDYENEDIYDTLYNYGFEDNYSDWTSLHIPWKLLIYTLAERVGNKNIHVSNKAESIEYNKNTNEFVINVNQGSSQKDNQEINYICKKVIIATDIQTVVTLLPKFTIYRQIHGQPFLRVYGKFSKKSIPILKKYIKGLTIVPGPLHKIIPIDSNKGIYMIAYTDNNGAIYLKNNLENTENNRIYFTNLFIKAIGIPQEESISLLSIKDYYWPIGTHYYQPLSNEYKNRKDFIDEAQHPLPNILVVGEVVALNQGWTQGALESVENVVTKKWIKS